MPAVKGRHQPLVGRRLEGLQKKWRKTLWLARRKAWNAEVKALREAGYLAKGSCIVRREEMEAARKRKEIAERGGMSSEPGVEG
jgi:hypothetical protein